MAKKYYETLEFKALSKQWEKILEQEGLADAETSVGEKRALRQNASNVYRQMDPTRREAKELYFQQLGRCLHSVSLSFDNEVDKMVMVLRAQGAKITEICAALIEAGCSRYRRTVRLIIRKYEDRWGIRNWNPEQLKYRWKRRQAIP
jgi:hypothetical protein